MTDDIVAGGSPAIRQNGAVSGPGPVVGAAMPAPAGSGPAGVAAPDGEAMRPLMVFTGSGWELFKIHLLNYIFTILTFGVYSFWAKVKVRRYLWGNTEILGERLEYTGTGGELFKSFLVVTALGGLGMVILYACSMFFPLAGPVVIAATVAVGHFASYQALRYRLTRTRWHGIRGNMDGSSVRYAQIATGYSILTLLTLFVCVPLQTARLTARRVRAAFFGNRRFAFTGTSRPLFAAWMQSYILLVLCIAGVVLVLFGLDAEETAMRSRDAAAAALGLIVVLGAILMGLCSLIYNAAVVRWLFGNLAFGSMRFDAKSYTPWRLLRLRLVNGLLLTVTLGLAYSWTEIRSLRFFLSSVRYAGDPALADLLQDTLPEKSRGEGLLDALDMDLAI
ncbi:MAG: DUF898 domain-containing protein [Deltaproteobacteria bacterium]|nr:DUF898 domain-containing protein [Deltaproteobacteria bacterium]